MHIEKFFLKQLDQNSKKRFSHGNSDNSKCYLIGFGDKKVISEVESLET